MDRAKKVLVGTIIIVAVIVFSSIFLFNKWTKETPTTTTTTIPTTTTITPTTTTIAIAYENPRLIESIDKNVEVVSENPDLIFEELPEDYVKSLLNFKFVNMDEVPETFYPWKGDAAYFLEGYPLGIDKEGVVSMHPQSNTTPTYLYQEIDLGSDDYIVVATIANIADYIFACNPCSDNIFKIKITDLETELEEKIYEDEINAAEGWQTIHLDISDYKNKNIRFVMEGHAGGVCGSPDPSWCQEWAAVDEFYIGRFV